MSIASASIAEDLAPTGTLRATVNLGNRLLVQGTRAAPAGNPSSPKRLGAWSAPTRHMHHPAKPRLCRAWPCAGAGR